VSGYDHSTVFKARPDEDLTEKKSTSDEVKEIIKKFIPPILLDLSKGKNK
jgi:hypothetical protein